MKTIKLPHIEAIARQWKENPIVEKLEDSPIPGITQKEHIKELQEILVQTCLDHINKHGLTDIYSVSFNADELAYSQARQVASGN